MAKKITITQLKNELKDKDTQELTDIILELSKTLPQVTNYFTLKFSPNNTQDLLDEAKSKIRKEFFPKRGFGKARLSIAKKPISEFKKMSSDLNLILDLMLYYVETCNDYTKTYGDINSQFYYSGEVMYYEAVRLVNTSDFSIYKKFADRFEYLAKHAWDVWDFRGALAESYRQIDWLDFEERTDMW